MVCWPSTRGGKRGPPPRPPRPSPPSLSMRGDHPRVRRVVVRRLVVPAVAALLLLPLHQFQRRGEARRYRLDGRLDDGKLRASVGVSRLDQLSLLRVGVAEEAADDRRGVAAPGVERRHGVAEVARPELRDAVLAAQAPAQPLILLAREGLGRELLGALGDGVPALVLRTRARRAPKHQPLSGLIPRVTDRRPVFVARLVNGDQDANALVLATLGHRLDPAAELYPALDLRRGPAGVRLQGERVRGPVPPLLRPQLVAAERIPIERALAFVAALQGCGRVVQLASSVLGHSEEAHVRAFALCDSLAAHLPQPRDESLDDLDLQLAALGCLANDTALVALIHDRDVLADVVHRQA